MVRTRVKVCGLTRPQDVDLAVTAGVDAVGFVAVPRSRRHVDPAWMAALARRVPPFVTRVGLFMDAPPAEVEAYLRGVALDLLQFHGAEDAAYCERFGCPYLKAIPCGGVAADALPEHLDAAMHAHPQAQGFLLDGHAGGKMGGSGERFDWAAIPQDLSRPWVLAGGLTAEHVTAALAACHAPAVDVSSGVESAPGEKDRALLERFMAAVAGASAIIASAPIGVASGEQE